jgi:hypothetical protein
MYSVLKALNLESVVFDVSLDATAFSVTSATNATIMDLKNDGGKLTWKASENFLPLPINRKNFRYDSAFGDIPFQQEFNRQTLKIANLKPGEYALTIEGKLILRT